MTVEGYIDRVISSYWTKGQYTGLPLRPQKPPCAPGGLDQRLMDQRPLVSPDGSP